MKRRLEAEMAGFGTVVFEYECEDEAPLVKILHASLWPRAMSLNICDGHLEPDDCHVKEMA